MFDELNRVLWRGRLPKYRVVRCATLRVFGRCHSESKTIVIQPRTPGEEWRTLVHEMCHIGTRPREFHGPVFLRKMARAARLLADPTLLRDFTLLQHAPPVEVAVSNDLENFAFELPEPWNVPWRRVRRVLADQYHLSPAEFDRQCPGGQREWERLVKGKQRDQQAEAMWQRLLPCVGGTVPVGVDVRNVLAPEERARRQIGGKSEAGRPARRGLSATY